MNQKIEEFLKKYKKENLPQVKPGDWVRVYFKTKEGNEWKTHPFEGIVIARKHGKEIGATITVRRVVGGIGIEKIFPLHSPLLERIEILKREKVRRAKLYYLRNKK